MLNDVQVNAVQVVRSRDDRESVDEHRRREPGGRRPRRPGRVAGAGAGRAGLPGRAGRAARRRGRPGAARALRQHRQGQLPRQSQVGPVPGGLQLLLAGPRVERRHPALLVAVDAGGERAGRGGAARRGEPGVPRLERARAEQPRRRAGRRTGRRDQGGTPGSRGVRLPRAAQGRAGRPARPGGGRRLQPQHQHRCLAPRRDRLDAHLRRPGRHRRAGQGRGALAVQRTHRGSGRATSSSSRRSSRSRRWGPTRSRSTSSCRSTARPSTARGS